jgi:hypothetical protein
VYTLERLEAALLARWGREEMTVYADYLQSIGDPRGEVIAIDLVNLDKVNEAAWRKRRQAVLAAWLGAELAEKFGGQIFQGFVQEASADTALLDSPAGEFVRAARFSTTDRAVYERFTQRVRPWVTHLSIAIPDRTRVIDDALAASLMAVTPRLDQLVLRGDGFARRIAHPTVRHVRVEGTPVRTLGWGGDAIRPPGATFAIERVAASHDARLYFDGGDGSAKLVDDSAIQKYVTHVRLGGVDLGVAMRALSALPRLAVIELSPATQDWRAPLAKKFPHVTFDR